MPNENPNPPIAILKPPPKSVAAVEAVVWTNPMFRSAARNEPSAPSPRARTMIRQPISSSTVKYAMIAKASKRPNMIDPTSYN